MILSDIILVEVGPRDGLQNIECFIPTEIKLAFINALIVSGLKRIEVTSFVSDKKVPQLRDAKEISSDLKKPDDVEFDCLVPNRIGLDAALKHDYDRICFFTSPSEGFCQKNIGCSITESLVRYQSIVETKPNKKTRVYLSCLWGCPYDGEIPIKDTLKLIEQLIEMGVHEISLGDTLGLATPTTTKNLLKQAIDHFSTDFFAVHFHDTYSNAVNNISESLDLGIRIIDSSAGGLGGCPYAPGARGNVATEHVIKLLNERGVHTGMDINKIIQSAKIIKDFIQNNQTSQHI